MGEEVVNMLRAKEKCALSCGLFPVTEEGITLMSEGKSVALVLPKWRYPLAQHLETKGRKNNLWIVVWPIMPRRNNAGEPGNLGAVSYLFEAPCQTSQY